MVRLADLPAWEREHSTDDTWRLVSFVRTVPTLTPEELESAGLKSETEHREHEHHEHGQPGTEMQHSPRR